MPALSDRGTNVVDMSGYEPVQGNNSPPMGGLPEHSLAPGLNVFLRCPLPQVWSAPSDALRQYFRGGSVPQVRLFSPNTVVTNSGGTTNNITVNSVSSSSGSSTSTIAVNQTSVKTPTVGPNVTFAGSFTLSKVFQLITVGVSSPCRIRLYGTAAAQSADSYRGVDVPPPAGTAQNIICDVVLDTSPLQWTFQDRVGANGDSATTSTIYISVTNLDSISESITLSFSFVPIVS